jgi:hypothetical protein
MLHEYNSSHSLKTMLHEYNSSHSLTPTNDQPSRLGEVWRQGGDLGKALAHDDQPATRLAMVQPTYSSPIKNMRAAEAAKAELGNLEGEELRW